MKKNKNMNKKDPQNHLIDINGEKMDKSFDELIDKTYGSLLGRMTRIKIEKTMRFTFDVLIFISENNPHICNELFRDILSSAGKYLIEKSIDFSTFNKEAKKIREYMNEGGGRRWFTWDDPETSCIRASLGLFIKMETKGDHEYILSDTFLQVIECVNINLELISKNELMKFINKYFN
ncbi:hypothetical protein NLN84_22700 [Citrobacter portucalensis]|uniref:hypothetical protein n=1 Tax=Citrobacter portucalensis TaxID=1639133 RepID=UPI00226B41E7|nr:hypothetical protein [Citrobacter portucalensis]MCX9068383.1 hypothetical protein [Citrobacter portucalensis]